jgi:large subunit ribosomal protein L22
MRLGAQGIRVNCSGRLGGSEIARDVRKVLLSAIANAENNHDLDVDRLVVAEASVGKSLVMKRVRPRARGRAGRIVKPFARLRIVVQEQEEAA